MSNSTGHRNSGFHGICDETLLVRPVMESLDVIRSRLLIAPERNLRVEHDGTNPGFPVICLRHHTDRFINVTFNLKTLSRSQVKPR